MIQLAEGVRYVPSGETPIPREAQAVSVPEYVKIEVKARSRISRMAETFIPAIFQRGTSQDREALVRSANDSRQLSAPQRSFKEFLRLAPLAGVDLERVKDFDRELDLP